MGIELDPSDDNSWDVVRTYASWSIHVELAADADAFQVIACLHDCGYSVTAELTTDEAVEVSRKLADIVPVVPLHEARERDEAEWATAREARRTKRNERLSGFFRRS
jgi:HD superfamily phosphodiesterase